MQAIECEATEWQESEELGLRENPGKTVYAATTTRARRRLKKLIAEETITSTVEGNPKILGTHLR